VQAIRERIFQGARSRSMTTSDAPPKIAPHVDFAVRQALPSLVLDLAMPMLVFFALRAFGVSTLLAIVAGGVFPLINVGRGWLLSQRIKPLGIIVITCIAFGTAAALISGSVLVALLKDFVLMGSFGLLFLASVIVAERPVMFYILRQFVAGNDPARLQWWEGLWQHQRFRAAQRRVTIIWGLGLFIEALIGTALACLLMPAEVVIISPIMAISVLAVLGLWTRGYLLALRNQHIGAVSLR
jgi:intracellular septation protein A